LRRHFLEELHSYLSISLSSTFCNHGIHGYHIALLFILELPVCEGKAVAGGGLSELIKKITKNNLENITN